eukprot:5716065-Amphidinium_carterae.1
MTSSQRAQKDTRMTLFSMSQWRWMKSHWANCKDGKVEWVQFLVLLDGYGVTSRRPSVQKWFGGTNAILHTDTARGCEHLPIE